MAQGFARMAVDKKSRIRDFIVNIDIQRMCFFVRYFPVKRLEIQIIHGFVINIVVEEIPVKAEAFLRIRIKIRVLCLGRQGKAQNGEHSQGCG